MSVDLNVWSNHKLKFDSYKEAIDEFELAVSKKLNQWNFKSDEPLVKTNQINNIDFFTNFEILEYNFKKWNQIRIWTNFEFCEEVTLLPKSIKLNPIGFTTRHTKWLDLVIENFKEVETEEELAKRKAYRQNWLLFREFGHAITTKLGGDKIIYLNDNSYQQQEDGFYEGKPFEEVIKLLSINTKPVELELFQLFSDNDSAKYTWHYEELKNLK